MKPVFIFEKYNAQKTDILSPKYCLLNNRIFTTFPTTTQTQIHLHHVTFRSKSTSINLIILRYSPSQMYSMIQYLQRRWTHNCGLMDSCESSSMSSSWSESSDTSDSRIASGLDLSEFLCSPESSESLFPLAGFSCSTQTQTIQFLFRYTDANLID